MNLEKLFEDIFFENLYRESIEAEDREERKKNPDGQSIDYQNHSKIPQVKQYGCYLYSLIKGAKRNPQRADSLYQDFVSNGYMNSNCLIQEPAEILHKCNGHEYDYKRSDKFDPNADIAIAKWSNGQHEHFVLMKNEKDVKFDSLGHSNTVATGQIPQTDGWRLFYDKTKTA